MENGRQGRCSDAHRPQARARSRTGSCQMDRELIRARHESSRLERQDVPRAAKRQSREVKMFALHTTKVDTRGKHSESQTNLGGSKAASLILKPTLVATRGR